MQDKDTTQSTFRQRFQPIFSKEIWQKSNSPAKVADKKELDALILLKLQTGYEPTPYSSKKIGRKIRMVKLAINVIVSNLFSL